MPDDAKKKLVDFIVSRVLDPVLRAKADGLSDTERQKLEQVQNATRAEIERYRDYGSAREVVVNFKRDLASRPARKVHADLRALHLPILNDIRDEFEAKARELGIDTSA